MSKHQHSNRLSLSARLAVAVAVAASGGTIPAPRREPKEPTAKQRRQATAHLNGASRPMTQAEMDEHNARLLDKQRAKAERKAGK